MKNPLVAKHPLGRNWPLTAGDVRRLFGLSPNATLPDRFVHGDYYGPEGRVHLYIAPKGYGLVNQKNRRAHRIFAICPFCQKDIPFGRMGQHVRRRDHQ